MSALRSTKLRFNTTKSLETSANIMERKVKELVAKASMREPNEIQVNQTLVYDLGIFLEDADELFYQLSMINSSLSTELDLRRYFPNQSPHFRPLTNILQRVSNAIVGTSFTPIPKRADRDITVQDLVDSCRAGNWVFDREL